MAYTRSNPSLRYRELLTLYRQMHAEGERFLNVPPDQTFSGASLPPQAPVIKGMVDVTGARTLLDYGSGKGLQYMTSPIHIPGTGTVKSVLTYWGVESVCCYDPNYLPFSKLPTGRFDGVISTDVLEHCPEEDLPWILDEIFAYADKFVFANAACYPAHKRLPNGENAHCTIRAPDWWEELILETAGKYPKLKWRLVIQQLQGASLVETVFSNC